MRVRGVTSAILRVTAGAVLAFVAGTTAAGALEPCGDFGECKAFVEINASDGDLGFHSLIDGEDLNSVKASDPNGAKVFEMVARGPLREQKLTELFFESAEPLCWHDPDADPDEVVETLPEFLARWAEGTYFFRGKGGGVISEGETELTHNLPAAPADVDFDGSMISWAAGDDLGRCGSASELDDLVADGVLPMHPRDVPVAYYEVVLEPDVEDGDPTGQLELNIRVAGDTATKAVEVPASYLASLPDDTPVKVEVGAVGATFNATFTEVGGFCVNEVAGCED